MKTVLFWLEFVIAFAACWLLPFPFDLIAIVLAGIIYFGFKHFFGEYEWRRGDGELYSFLVVLLCFVGWLISIQA